MLEYKSSDVINDESYIHTFKYSEVVNKIEHTHDFIEIVYILSGKAVERINGFEFNVKHGDLLFINYGCTHSFDFEGNFSYINVCFNPKLLGRTISKDVAFPLLSLTAFDELKGNDGLSLCFVGNERSEIEMVLNAMLKEEKEKLPMWNNIVESYMNILIGLILRKYLSKEITEDIKEDWLELIEFIENNLGTKLTLKTLSEKCFYNPAYFSRIFKEKFNITLTEYVMRKRIEQASKMLLETDMSIDQVARSCGYETISAFYRAFNKIKGMSVSDFRKK